MAQLAFFLDRSGLVTTGNRVFVATDAADMKGVLGPGRFSGFDLFYRFALVPVTLVAGLHDMVTRLMLVMTGSALRNT